METYTVKKLRAIAKERGIKRHGALRKAELIATIKAHLANNHSLVDAPAPDISASHLAANNHSLVDAPVPDISASVLTPTKYVAPPQKEATIKSFRDWFYVPEQIKNQSSHSLIG